MQRILFSGDKIKFDGTNIIFVPDGDDPADCACCGSQCPVCVDYTYGELEVTVSGFPSSITWVSYEPIFNQSIYLTWTGLQKLNGVYTLTTDANCIWSSELKSVSVDQEKVLYLPANGYCSFLGSTVTTNSTFDAIMVVAAASVGVAYGTLTRKTQLTIADPCVGGSDSEFYANNRCPTVAGFTAAATWVPTLV